MTKSWHDYQVKELVRDFQQEILQVHDAPYQEEIVGQIPGAPHEFPNGYNFEYGSERFKISEALFDPGRSEYTGQRLNSIILMTETRIWDGVLIQLSLSYWCIDTG